MAQRRRRRARCMLHCPQRHVAIRWRDVDPRRGAVRTACYGNRDGCTHSGAHDRYPDFIPRPDETPSPNGQHAHVTHPDIVIEICWLTSSASTSSPFLRRQPTVPFCFLGRRTRPEGSLPINSQLQHKPFLPFHSLSQTALCIVMQEIATQPVHRAKG